VPEEALDLHRCSMQLGLVVTPLAVPHEEEPQVPCIDAGDSGPLRCSRCKGYVSNFARFSPDGSVWACSLCGHHSAVPAAVRCPADERGLRSDREARPELAYSSVDYVARAWLKDAPPPPRPVYVFAVDVSTVAQDSGLTDSGFAAAIAGVAAAVGLHGPGGARFGVVTFDSLLHFFYTKVSGIIQYHFSMLLQACVEPDPKIL
jgi:protein transport protein SEC24